MSEPVAWMWDIDNGGGYSSRGIGFQKTDIPFAKHTPLYATPPNREWVGLTDEEILAAGLSAGFKAGSVRFNLIVQSIEAKLKEKNGG